MTAGAGSPGLASGRRRDVLALLVVFSLITIVFADVLFLGNQFGFRDLTRYYFPAKHVLREIVRGGEFPFWNRYFAAGQPLAANPEFEVFYPPQWLVIALPYELGFRLHVLLHFYIAAAGLYAFMRARGRRAETAALTASSFVFAGYFLSTVSLLPILFVIAWLPWVLLFTREFVRRPNRRSFALAAIFVGMQCLAAEPVSLVLSSVLLAGYAAFEAWSVAGGGGRKILRGGLAASLIVAAGIVVGLAQILPAIDHARDSVRSRGLAYREVTQWSMPLIRPLELVAPSAFGDPEAGVWWGGRLYPLRGAPFYVTISFGLLSLVLAVAALVTRVRGWAGVAAASAAGYALAIGANGPLHAILFDAGVAQSARYPEKFILLSLVPLTILAGDALDLLLDGDRRVRSAAVASSVCVALAAAAFATFASGSSFPQTFAQWWPGAPNPPVLAAALRGSIVVVCVKAAFLSVLFLLSKRIPARYFFASAALFWAVDVLPLSSRYLPRYPAAFFDPPPAAAPIANYLGRDRLFHEADFWTLQNQPNPYDRTPARELMVRNGLLPMLPARWGIAMALDVDFDRTALLPTDAFAHIFANAMHHGRRDAVALLMAMSDVRARAVFRPVASQRAALEANPETVTPIAVLPVPSNGRYYFSDAVVQVKDAADFEREVSARRWSPRAAFVDFPPFAAAPGTVLAVDETANAASVRVRATGRALLVASVTHHKYWRATIDGVRVPLHVANVAYQAVVVPQGTHTVAFRYRNPVVVAAGSVSAAALLLLTVVAAVPARRRPRSNSDGVEDDRDDHEQLHGIEDTVRDDAGQHVLRPVEREADDERDHENADQQQRLAEREMRQREEQRRGHQADPFLQE